MNFRTTLLFLSLSGGACLSVLTGSRGFSRGRRAEEKVRLTAIEWSGLRGPGAVVAHMPVIGQGESVGNPPS